MRRFGRAARCAIIGAVLAAGVLGAVEAQPGAGPMRSVPVPAVTAPPLPFGAPSGVADNGPRGKTPASRAVSGLHGLPLWRIDPSVPSLPVRAPSLADALRRVNAKRRASNANGGTIVLTGSQTVPVINQTFYYTWDGTIPYGQTDYLQCVGLKAGNPYEYVVFPPKAPASANLAAMTTDASGNCPGNGMGAVSGTVPTGPTLTFSTPVGSGSPNPAYSGVWGLGMLNTKTNQYDALTFVVVIGGTTISVTRDAGGLQTQSDFKPGDTIYVHASGLNSGDNYAVGFTYTSAVQNGTSALANPNACVYELPVVTLPSNGPCFNNGAANAGTPQSTGTMTVGWNTSLSTTPAGAYQIELYDATQGIVVGSTPISIQPSTVGWTLLPSKGGATGTNLNDTFAFDGYIDQSTDGMKVTTTGVGSGDTLALTISSPSGTVMSAPVTAVASGGSATFPTVAWPVKGSTRLGGVGPFYPYVDVFGPTALTFASNGYTAQVYDRTTGAVIGSKNFQLLGYDATAAWTTPSTATLKPASGSTVNGTFTLGNVTATAIGANNADNITGFKVSGDGTDESVALPGGVTSSTTVDSAGNTWNAVLTNAGSGGTITLTPVSATVALSPGQTLPLPVVVTIAAGQCASASVSCNLKTQVLPQHGIAYSAADSVSPPLPVQASGTAPVAAGTYEDRVTAVPTAIAANRFNQLLYTQGTSGTAGTDAYTLNVTVNNPSNGIAIHSAILGFPFNGAGAKISAVYYCTSATVAQCSSSNGTTTAPNNTTWVVASASLSGQSGAQTNQTYLWGSCTNQTAGYNGNTAGNNCGVPTNASAGFVLTFPMPLATSTYADTMFEANPDGGCPPAAGGICGAALQTLTFNAQSGVTQNSPVNSSGSNLDSTELGVFSLDPLAPTFAPSQIGTGVTTSTTLNLTNTSQAGDSNPDPIDRVYLTVPYGAIPASISVSGWTVTQTQAGASPSTPAKYTLSVSCLPSCSPANITGAVAAGATLPIVFNYTGSQANGTYTVTTQAEGANGGALSAALNSTLVVSSAAASVAFVDAGGYPTGASVGGAEPQVGSDADPTYGNAFDYRIVNNGSTAITSVTVTIPFQNRYSVTPSISTWPNGTNPLKITSTPTLGGTAAASSCSVGTVTQPTGSANGSFTITCAAGAFPANKYLDVLFDMQVPYDVGSEYVFPATINGGVSTTSQYVASNWLQIVLDARLSVLIPSGTALSRPGVGSPATVSCAGCAYTPTATPPIIAVGPFTGTFSLGDVMNASVISDATSPNGWKLYVSVDNNPVDAANGTAELSGMVDTANSSAVSGYSTSLTTSTILPVIPAPSAANPGLLLSSYFGAARRSPNEAVDTVMNFTIAAPGDVTTPRAVTVTYTLVPQ